MISPMVVTLGETMGLLRAKEVGPLEHVTDFALHIGGAESNVAIGIARLGGAAAWMGRVGDDGIGRLVVRELRAEQVQVHAVLDPVARTAIMLKETPAPGVTRVLYYRAHSAGSNLSPSDLDRDLIAQAGMLHVTGITLGLSDSAAEAVRTAVEVAVDAGVPVSFDINHRATLWGSRDPRDPYLAIAQQADVIFAGDDEAALLVGPGEPGELATKLAGLGPSQAIVKLGDRGCIASIDGVVIDAPAVPASVVDTVGAGDAFVAGYLSALLEQAPPDARLIRAVRCGAFACLGPGDWESLPRTADLERIGSPDPVAR